MNKAQEIIANKFNNKFDIAHCLAMRIETRGNDVFFGMDDNSTVAADIYGNCRALSPILQPVIRRPKDKYALRLIVAASPLLGELSDDFADFLYEAQEDFHRKYMEPTRNTGVDHRFFCGI